VVVTYGYLLPLGIKLRGCYPLELAGPLGKQESRRFMKQRSRLVNRDGP
jgi:hypothetical protein